MTRETHVARSSFVSLGVQYFKMLSVSRTNPSLSHRHERIWYLPVYLLISILLVSCCCGPTLAVDTDLALGEWKMQLKSHQLDAIFPILSQSLQSDASKQSVGSRRMKRALLSLWPPRTCECHLSVFSNGTFALEGPSLMNNRPPKREHLPVRSDNLEPRRRLSVHGRWFAPNNPYCATDRFYQSIRLESFPRQQRLLEPGISQQSNGNTAATTTLLQRHQLILHGRLVGQFQRRNHSQAVGRMTHGKIVQENLLPPSHSTSGWLQPVVASFVAQQITPLSVDEDDE